MEDMTWNELVKKEAMTLRAQQEADKEAFLSLLGILNDPRAERDGETLERDDEQASKSLHGVPVFSVSVEKSRYVVYADHEGRWFEDRPDALKYMARLMALAYDKSRREKAKAS